LPPRAIYATDTSNFNTTALCTAVAFNFPTSQHSFLTVHVIFSPCQVSAPLHRVDMEIFVTEQLFDSTSSAIAVERISQVAVTQYPFIVQACSLTPSEH
jgi:hypothetical protein